MLLATGVTVASLAKLVDITPLVENGEIRRGEVWRLLTSALPHGDPLHLLFNLYWMWVFGTLVEKVFGIWRTLAIFMLLAVVSGAAEFALLRGGIGLSGVGYGLFGMVWVLSKRDARFTGAVDSKTVQLFVGWFFFCIFLTYSGYPIANIAHAVGCGTGALLGWTIATSPRLRAVGIASVMILLAATVVGATVGRPWLNLEKYAGGDTAKYAGYDEAKFGFDALAANKNDQAARWYRDAVRMNPRDAGYWYNLGIAYQRLSMADKASAAYQRACDLDPSDPQYQSALEQLR
jgi:membrane associated rhomboid family serine protease